MVAKMNGWSETEKAGQMVNLLEGQAAEIIDAIPEQRMFDYNLLKQ